MAVEAITGLPGSGKSCYATKKIYDQLLNWARYKKKHGKPYPRKLYTNIPLKVREINAALSEELGESVDLSEQIVILTDEFFKGEKGEFTEWWKKFENGGYIIIDEVHHFLPALAGKTKQEREFHKGFMNYVSTHRHNQHDIIFMTQHLNNVHAEVKKMVAVVYEVLNVKNMMAGPFWPYQIPMSDIDVVREAWGVAQQFAHVKRGRMEGRKTIYDKNCEMFLLSPFLFNLYKSHTKSEETTDRPSLRLGKVGSVIWLVRRHGLRLVCSTVFIVTLLIVGWHTIQGLPNTVMSAITGGIKETKKVEKPENMAASIPLIPEPLPEKAVEDDKITGLLRGAVITPRGVLRQGDEIVHDGEKDTVSSVDFGKGIIYLGSGKKVHK